MALQHEIFDATTVELAHRIRTRDVSPVEVMDATIAAIEADNERLNAFVHLAFEEARERAQAAEREVSSGAKLGPLHGVPTAMKDLFDFKPGWPSTFGGVRALKDYVPDFYCAWAERMEQAGAIILGKTNSPVMGFRGTCDNPLFGPTRNPFDPVRNTGGSSGGSAAAVAAGLLTVAEGTDGGGSVRIPAAWCGVYGYKQSFGRVPYIARPNAFTGLHPFLFEGAITRTVEDAALVIDAISGYDPRDPFSLDERADLLPAVRQPISGWRIAYSPAFDVFPVDPAVAGVVAEAVRAFELAGAHVEEVRLGITHDQRELSDLWCRLITPINVATFETFKRNGLDLLADHRDDFPPEYLRWIDAGYELRTPQLMRDEEIRTEIYDAIQGVLADHDLLVTPTLACLPVENAADGNTKGPSRIGDVAVDPLIGWCLTYPVNFSGHPAASIPAGMIDGLPVGMQLIGRRYADADVLAASAAIERIRPWRDTYRSARAVTASLQQPATH
ncbi:amidase [Candidatus Solirubrobacter pratensis]|uniref:amidase n=1 Tax=Candidatus Solirubrobacter pratensis TaxID=1298857 RepID=UPI0004044E69|nr:amidase [Candidatus Solirubrobacter pratensis]